ncbi:MAG: isoprenylcysteine carboxylmethyltransferase family protein [Burkholderiales bacterium]|jgi:protein-S-isoprenylcysteine O-methyltransferase Ste14|nr:isoprenylcysteine carboxylmethyltransferase family protein [Burkholderiales bacterium]
MPFVVPQFTLIFILLMPWTGCFPDWMGAPAIAAYAILFVAGLLFLWVFRHNRPGNFNFRPEPPPDNQLVTSGPYRFIRHPMYLSLLLMMLGIVLLYGEPWRWLALGALGAVLHFKALREERFLCERFPEYSDYKARTKSILPFVL